jgi:hypothetical protein
MKKGVPVGIPQGLPISSVLANLYLLNFDKAINNNVVRSFRGYYRRYSDDILIICKPSEVEDIIHIVKTELGICKLDPSDDKTELFIFKPHHFGKKGARLTAFQILEKGVEKIKPLTYLGFHFYGHQSRIKSANLAKFHRKTIDAVKRKTARIERIITKCTYGTPAIFVNQVRKLSTAIKPRTPAKDIIVKQLRMNRLGEHYYFTKPVSLKHKSNYISYVRRAANIFEDPGIYRQIRKRKKILHEALALHYKKKIDPPLWR